MTAYSDFQDRLSALGLHYTIDQEVRLKGKALYQWATIRSAVPKMKATSSVLTLLRKDGTFDLWVLKNTPIEIGLTVDLIAAEIVGQMLEHDMNESEADDWIAFATRGFDDGQSNGERIPNASARWLESKVEHVAGA